LSRVLREAGRHSPSTALSYCCVTLISSGAWHIGTGSEIAMPSSSLKSGKKRMIFKTGMDPVGMVNLVPHVNH